jgi:hypothetical protein
MGQDNLGSRGVCKKVSGGHLVNYDGSLPRPPAADGTVVIFTLSRGTFPIIPNNKLWNGWKTPVKLSAILNIMFDCVLMTRRRFKATFYVEPTDINVTVIENNIYWWEHRVGNVIVWMIAVSVSTKEVLVIEQSSTLGRCGERRIENKWSLLFVLFICWTCVCGGIVNGLWD